MRTNHNDTLSDAMVDLDLCRDLFLAIDDVQKISFESFIDDVQKQIIKRCTKTISFYSDEHPGKGLVQETLKNKHQCA